MKLSKISVAVGADECHSWTGSWVSPGETPAALGHLGTGLRKATRQCACLSDLVELLFPAGLW